MRKILFNPQPTIELLQAVLAGRKTQTCRLPSKRPYKVDEVLAIAEPFYLVKTDKSGYIKDDALANYCYNIQGSYSDAGYKFGFLASQTQELTDLGIDVKSLIQEGELFSGNRQGFPSALARNFIRITSVSTKKPCDFTVDEALAEGIWSKNFGEVQYVFYHPPKKGGFCVYYDYRETLRYLFERVFGEKEGAKIFESTSVVYTFVLCDKDGKDLVKT